MKIWLQLFPLCVIVLGIIIPLSQSFAVVSRTATVDLIVSPHHHRADTIRDQHHYSFYHRQHDMNLMFQKRNVQWNDDDKEFGLKNQIEKQTTDNHNEISFLSALLQSSSSISTPFPSSEDNNDNNDSEYRKKNDDDDVSIASNTTQQNKFPLKKVVIVLWIHVLSIFMLINYFWAATPQALFSALPLRAWSFLHAISAMVFSGSIITTTVLEWKIIDAEFATKRLFPMEQILVLPALSLTILSGVAQVFETYMPTTLRYAPPHIKSVFYVLFLFGLWWGFTDRKSQGPLEELIEASSDGTNNASKNNEKEIEAALKQRRLFNIVSCGFVLALYAIMIFKPGY